MSILSKCSNVWFAGSCFAHSEALSSPMPQGSRMVGFISSHVEPSAIIRSVLRSCLTELRPTLHVR